MTTKHTPGPWIIHEREHPEKISTGDSGFQVAAYIGTVQEAPGSTYRFVCEITGWGEDYSTDRTQQANARLIAAAPAMLAKLIEAERFLTDSWPGGDDFCPHAVALRAVRDAIAQAEG